MIEDYIFNPSNTKQPDLALLVNKTVVYFEARVTKWQAQHWGRVLVYLV